MTADHSHVMTISGYPQRGNPILGFAGISDVDDLPYTTLSYANGPGFKRNNDYPSLNAKLFKLTTSPSSDPDEHGERFDLTNDNLGKPGL